MTKPFLLVSYATRVKRLLALLVLSWGGSTLGINGSDSFNTMLHTRWQQKPQRVCNELYNFDKEWNQEYKAMKSFEATLPLYATVSRINTFITSVKLDGYYLAAYNNSKGLAQLNKEEQDYYTLKVLDMNRRFAMDIVVDPIDRYITAICVFDIKDKYTPK